MPLFTSVALPKFFTPPLSESVVPASTVSTPLPVKAPPLQLLLPVSSRLPVPCRLPPDSVRPVLLLAVLKLTVPPEIDKLPRVCVCAVLPPRLSEPLPTESGPRPALLAKLPMTFTVAPLTLTLPEPTMLEPAFRLCVPLLKSSAVPEASWNTPVLVAAALPYRRSVPLCTSTLPALPRFT